MVICVADLFKSDVGGGEGGDGPYTGLLPPANKRQNRKKPDEVADRNIARLQPEVEPPRGHIALVFTDIKNSTLLWDKKNMGMVAALKLHHNLLRRLLRLTNGYEVKTEGDAFMVSFSDVLLAVHWCFMVQEQLLHEAWPKEILESEDGKEVRDSEDRLIARGLSVRMGIHSGSPYCEKDPVTHRMDYFGPMVNRAARIMSSADGGQIMCSRDVIKEIKDRVLADGAEKPSNPDLAHTIEALQLKGIKIKEVGERRMKGIEEPELISLICPNELEGRLDLEAGSGMPAATQAVDKLVEGHERHILQEVESNEDEAKDIDTQSDFSIIIPSSYAPLLPSPSLPSPFDMSDVIQNFTLFNDIPASPFSTIGEEEVGEVESLEDQTSRLAHLCLRVETLSSKRVFRPNSSSEDDTGLIFSADPELLLPPLRGRSTSELHLLLDSFSIRIQNALSTLQLQWTP